jgi:hypothetical protein
MRFRPTGSFPPSLAAQCASSFTAAPMSDSGLGQFVTWIVNRSRRWWVSARNLREQPFVTRVDNGNVRRQLVARRHWGLYEGFAYARSHVSRVVVVSSSRQSPDEAPPPCGITWRSIDPIRARRARQTSGYADHPKSLFCRFGRNDTGASLRRYYARGWQNHVCE